MHRPVHLPPSPSPGRPDVIRGREVTDALWQGSSAVAVHYYDTARDCLRLRLHRAALLLLHGPRRSLTSYRGNDFITPLTASLRTTTGTERRREAVFDETEANKYLLKKRTDKTCLHSSKTLENRDNPFDRLCVTYRTVSGKTDSLSFDIYFELKTGPTTILINEIE